MIVTLIVAGIVVLLAGGGGVYWALRPTTDEPTPGPTHAGQGANAACGYKLAYLGVLTGSNAADGTMVRDSAALALEAYNSQHGSCTTQLVSFDTNTTEPAKVAQQIVDDDKILGVVGPLYLDETNAALPVLEKGGVPTISPAATETGLSSNGWRVFHRTLGTDLDQARAGARYLTDILHAKKTIIVTDDTDYGKSTSAEVSRVLGSSVADTVPIKRDAKDYASVMARILSAGADSMYLGAFYDDGALFVKQLRASNKTIKIVTGDRAFTDTFINDAGKDNAEGVIMTCPCVPASRAGDNFANRFKAKFNRSGGYYGPEAYDATNVLLAGLAAGKATRADLLSFVGAYDDQGVSRRIKFTAHGDLDVTSLQVWAYRVSGGYVDPEQVIPEA
jgi:branched-chain amino acid transport system substrate-binding protein